MQTNRERELEGFALYYLAALDAGDMDGVGRCLEAACSDDDFNEIIVRVNDLVYEEEFGAIDSGSLPEVRLLMRWGVGAVPRVLFVYEGGKEDAGP